METLKNILLAQTAEFKAAFMSKTQAYAEREFNRAMEITLWNNAQWCQFFGIEPRIGKDALGKEFFGFPSNFHNTRNARTHMRMLIQAAAIVRKGQVHYINKALESAEKHYIHSIEKLAFRIQSKDLNIESIVVTSGFQGMNFECTITDGIKKVRAFTIIAEGEIVRPHYRYLIK